MNSEFIGTYCENLSALGFGIVEKRREGVTELQNAAGPVAYIGVLVDTDIISELKSFVEEYSAQFAKRAEKSQLKNIFLVYVFIGAGENIAAGEIIELGEIFDNNRIYPIYWYADTDSGKILFNEKQPSEASGMAKALNATFLKEPIKNKIIQPVQTSIFMTAILIAINGAIFALMGMALPASDTARMIKAGAIVPALVIEYKQYYRLLAAMFLHFDFMHFAANALGLFIFGGIVERHLGGFKMAVIYIAAGLAASAVCLLPSSAGSISAGASGAVYGFIGVTAVLTLKNPRASGFNFYNILVLIIVGVGISFIVPGISYSAHLGGLAAGILLGLILS